MKFSLILCTLERTDCLFDFFVHMRNQEFIDYEILVMDQNVDDRVVKVIDCYKDLPIVHIRCEKGLSLARNVGLEHAKGEIIAFPDDDCFYSDGMLKNVNDWFEAHPDIPFLSIKMTNSISGARKVQENIDSSFISKKDVFVKCASISIFVKKDVIDVIGGFDERLGLGSRTKFKAGEDYDFPLRVLQNNYQCYYNKEIEVFHPWNDENFIYTDKVATASYWAGATEIILINKYSISVMFKCRWIIRRILVLVYFLFTRKKSKFAQSKCILKGQICHFNIKDFYEV